MAKEEVRIDKWMWSTRIFKTRTIAVEACKKGRISMNGVTVKASRNIKLGDIIQVKKPPIIYSFQVVGLTERRVGAKLVPDFLKDVTPREQIELLEASRVSGFINRAKGMGRPTKRDRRDMDRFVAEYDQVDFDFDFDFDSDED